MSEAAHVTAEQAVRLNEIPNWNEWRKARELRAGDWVLVSEYSSGHFIPEDSPVLLCWVSENGHYDGQRVECYGIRVSTERRTYPMVEIANCTLLPSVGDFMDYLKATGFNNHSILTTRNEQVQWNMSSGRGTFACQTAPDILEVLVQCLEEIEASRQAMTSIDR